MRVPRWLKSFINKGIDFVIDRAVSELDRNDNGRVEPSEVVVWVVEKVVIPALGRNGNIEDPDQFVFLYEGEE